MGKRSYINILAWQINVDMIVQSADSFVLFGMSPRNTKAPNEYKADRSTLQQGSALQCLNN